jgi:hypothetical protein
MLRHAWITMGYLTAPAWIVRLVQSWHIGRIRLGRLLKRRGIDPAAYVRSLPIVEVEAQIADCHSCICQPLCDRAVRARTPSRSTYSFCPNTDAIERYLRRT